MWIFFNDGFVSAVEDRNDPARLCVRGRARKHLAGLFPDAEVLVTPDADYACRVFVDRTELSGLVERRVQEIDYANFKASVQDPALHHLYLSIWRAGWSFQNKQGPDGT